MTLAPAPSNKAPAPSNKSVDRAGAVIRAWVMGTFPAPTDVAVDNAKRTVEAFRQAHATPLLTARMGLQSCVATECRADDGSIQISQRLKKRVTVWDKLRREPKMRLSQMQDIGGCRAVLPSLDEIERVSKGLVVNSSRRNGREDRVYDYVRQPKQSGYRAVHIHTRYKGRRLEVQLRTHRQHYWARLVESLTNSTGDDFKNGCGPQEVHELLRQLGDHYEASDARRLHPSTADATARTIADSIGRAVLAQSDR